MSLWTETPTFRLQREHVVIHTLAACMASRVFESTEFVTDSRGIEIANRLGWKYTKYNNALDDLCGSGMKHIWALGKLTAIARQKAPFCHLDNDVLLHKPLPENILNARLFAQSKDIPDYYKGNDMQMACLHAGLSPDAVAYNVGIVGGNDPSLLRDYASEALELAKQFDGWPAIEGTTTSMVIEQCFLGEFSRRRCVRVEELISIHHTNEDLERVGYSHFIGRSKSMEPWVTRCEAKLASEFPDEYKAFLKGWRTIGDN